MAIGNVTSGSLLAGYKKKIQEQALEEVIREAQARFIADFCDDPEKYPEVVKFCIEILKPIAQPQWMGFGMQSVMDAVALALRDRGWASGRLSDLMADTASYLNQISDEIFTEYLFAKEYNEETEEPYAAKAKFDAALKPLYGENFLPWDERYGVAASESRKSCTDYLKREMEGLNADPD